MKLFEPGRIGRLWLKNRIIMAPLWTRLPEPDEEGRVGQRYIDRVRGSLSVRRLDQKRGIKPGFELHDNQFLSNQQQLLYQRFRGSHQKLRKQR